MKFLDQQIRIAKDNYNYFFMKLLFSVLKIIFNLSVVLLFSSVFNNLVINIIALIYTIYSMYSIYFVSIYYINIINDIKDTLGYNDYIFEIDFSQVNNSVIKGLVKYGK